METMEKAQASGPMTPEAALRADRTIALSLPVGVALFWGLSLALNPGDPDGAVAVAGVGVGTATVVVTALALAGLIAAFMLRLGAVAMIERRSGPLVGTPEFAAFRTRLILAWALLEAPALLAGIVHFVSGADQALLYVGPLYVLGVVLTVPRAEWYGVGRSGVA